MAGSGQQLMRLEKFGTCGGKEVFVRDFPLCRSTRLCRKMWTTELAP